MIGRPASQLIDGPAGALEIVVEDPSGPVRGCAVVAHPLPVQGGTMDNKVVHTLTRAFVQSGWRAVRFNFRGVGQSAGNWDEGRGEIDDMLAVVAHQVAEGACAGWPLALAGFSFGGFVAAQAQSRLADAAGGADALPVPAYNILVGPAVTRFQVPVMPATDTLVVHGEHDDVVPLASVFDWARPQALPVTVLPGAGHFFHGLLPQLREVLMRDLRGRNLSAPAGST